MVIIISVAVVSLYNNQKTNLVNMSRVSPPESAGVSGSVVVDPVMEERAVLASQELKL